MPATLEAPPKHLFTKETAKEMGERSGIARRLQNQQRKNLLAQFAPSIAEHLPDPIVSNLTRAMRETLTKCLTADNAKDAANYARALKDLREVWHMVTGQPKPGVRKLPIERPARLMLSPAVDAGHAQATREQPTPQPVVEPPSPEQP